MLIPITIRGGFDKNKLPSRSESSENIQLNKLEFICVFENHQNQKYRYHVGACLCCVFRKMHRKFYRLFRWEY